MTAPNLSTGLSRVSVGALLGGVVGVLAGFVLLALDAVGNPFYVMSLGIALGAATGIVPRPGDGQPRSPATDDEDARPR